MTDWVLASHSRFISHGQGDRIKVRGDWLSFLALGEQTGGAYALIETGNDPATGVRLHVHEREDETWFVLEGEYTFEVGGQTFRAGPGDYVFGPRNVPHSYANRTGSLEEWLEGIFQRAAKRCGIIEYTGHFALLRTWHNDGLMYSCRIVTKTGR